MSDRSLGDVVDGGRTAPVQATLLDYLHAHLAVQDKLDYRGAAGGVHRTAQRPHLPIGNL
ncbi:hypothetical protein ACFTXJ_14895 [Streptomyces zhihengii]|uniref:hypothetical protein n=1 Tax=Streptomyces zhihengii TaxID=1818004 RepID=UPI003639EE43